MTRTTTTKLVATALAVASLGLATTAQADDGQGIVAGENDIQVQKNVPTPGNPAPGIEDQVKDDGTKVAAQEQTEEVDYNSPEYFKSKEARDRFERYCNMKDAEPSHSDKKFCEDFRRHNGTTTTTTSGHGRPDYCKYVNVRYDPDCDKWHPKPHPRPTYPEHKPEYEKPHYKETKPVYEKAEEPSKGSLPFTGLEIWQLGLIGIVLVGGGIGARRLLVS
jgi:hypothetical protein